ncbi:unnamed protein product, partial [Polarella glacialis]
SKPSVGPALTAQIKAVGAQSRWADAVSLLFETDWPPPSELSFVAAIGACARAKRWEAALALLEAARSSSSRKLGVAIHTAVLRSLSDKPELSRALIAEMKAAQVLPDLLAYSAAVTGLDWSAAFALLAEAQQQGVRLDTMALNSGLSATGTPWLQAMQTLRRMHLSRLQPDSYSRNSCLSACEKANGGGRWEQGLALLSAGRAEGTALDVIAFSAAVATCEKARGTGRWDLALDLLVRCRSLSLQPNLYTFGAAVSSCEKGVRWEWGLELLGLAQSEGLAPNAVVIDAAISACEKSRNWESAMFLLRCLQSRVGAARAAETTAVAFGAAIRALGGGNAGSDNIAWPGALELLQSLRELGLRPQASTLNAVLSAA